MRLFAQYTHRLLRALGTAPHDVEIHHGEGIPLHLHLNARRYVYANIGGTLNSPTDVAENVVPPTRDIVRLLAARWRRKNRAGSASDAGWPAGGRPSRSRQGEPDTKHHPAGDTRLQHDEPGIRRDALA